MSTRTYEFTGETLTHEGVTLQRIRAIQDIPAQRVRAGDLGGWIESVENLSGDAWVSDNAKVWGNATVFEDARVSGDAQVYRNAQVSGDAQVYRNAQVCGDAQVYRNARVYGDAQVYGDAWVSGDAQVYGDARVSGYARVCEFAKMYGDARVDGYARVYGNARVYGDAQVSAYAQVYGDADISHPSHVLYLSRVGSENVAVTLFRTGKGHELKVGCWEGQVEGLMDEVRLRRENNWVGKFSEREADLMVEEYEVIESLCRARIARWGESEKGEDFEERGEGGSE